MVECWNDGSKRIPFLLFLDYEIRVLLAENIFVVRKVHENKNVKFEIRISKSETMTKFSKFKCHKSNARTIRQKIIVLNI